ncbi:DUF4177 domain-containing protein [Shouchella sp. 1P09AA]|uniref:DUF4177 domain-containing protein n=1 Tax=unclassified Shouchella TaxID=2893065 RepID=UPI0039A114C5
MEYKTILLPVALTKNQTLHIQDVLNQLADEGWELVSLQAQQRAGGIDGNLTVLKRNKLA